MNLNSVSEGSVLARQTSEPYAQDEMRSGGLRPEAVYAPQLANLEKSFVAAKVSAESQGAEGQSCTPMHSDVPSLSNLNVSPYPCP